MIGPALRLDQAPPLSVPLRFFLTAPLFGVLAALLLFWHGAGVFASRWSPPTLALTHLVTLGFLAHVMLGALLQMLPVLAGTPVARSRAVGGVVHALLAPGMLALVVGFLMPDSMAFAVAFTLLGSGFALFIAVALTSLWRAPIATPTVSAMRFALAGLAVTVMLGIALGLGARTGGPAPWTDVHLSWGLFGWVAMLIGGVAWQVVPMFQLTPPYPGWLQRTLGPVLFYALLGLSTALIVSPGGPAETFFGVVVAGALAGLAGTTLYLQQQRRRRLPDATLAFWRLAMASLLAAVLLWFATVAGLVRDGPVALMLGVLFLLGFAVSAVHGMLYKIVPFLVWLHLHRQTTHGAPPNMTISPGAKLDARSAPAGRSRRMANVKEILPDRYTRPHLGIHTAAVAATLGACLWPAVFTYPAALLLLLSFGWLERNLLFAALLYRHLVREHGHVA